jgi:hypothetical protein
MMSPLSNVRLRGILDEGSDLSPAEQVELARELLALRAAGNLALGYLDEPVPHRAEGLKAALEAWQRVASVVG